MNYKDYIETDYTDNYLQSVFRVRVFRAAGQAFLHWAIEPEKMNFATQGDAIYASFEFVLRLEDGRGRMIHETTEEIPLRISPEQYKAHERQRFSFQDLLAVAPGEYRALFLLKNKTAKDFSSFETRVSVPPAGASDRPALGVPLLAFSRSAVPEAQKRNLKAFAFGGQDYLVGARNEFTQASTLVALVQARSDAGAAAGARPSFVLDLVSLDTGESSGTFPLTEVAADPGDASTLLVSGSAPLKDVKPGYYRAEISARDAGGQVLAAANENFVVLSQPVPVVPWVYGRLHGPFPGPEHLKVLGSQYFLQGEYGKSRQVLEKVLGNREDPAARLLLAKVLYGLGLYQGIACPGRPPLRARRGQGGGQGGRPGPRRPEGLERGPAVSRASPRRSDRSPGPQPGGRMPPGPGPARKGPASHPEIARPRSRPACRQGDGGAGEKTHRTTIGVIDDIQESRMHRPSRHSRRSSRPGPSSRARSPEKSSTRPGLPSKRPR